MGGDKLAVSIEGRSVLRRTVDVVASSAVFATVVVVTNEERWVDVRREVAESGLRATLRLVGGGERRQDSVRLGLAAVGDADIVCVHDAARPLCPPRLFGEVVAAAERHGAATAALPLVDSIKRIDAAGMVVGSLDRSELVAVQTPQAFRTALLVDAHASACADSVVADDDSALVERLGVGVITVRGDPGNIKLTSRSDLAVLAAAIAASA